MAENGSKLLPCAFWLNVLCSFRKNPKFTVMDRCLKCSHYERFMRKMEKDEEEEDAEFLEESEHVNRFAKCLFEDCLCDGQHGKLSCFGYELVGDRPVVWTCGRFVLETLKADNAMREAYLDLLGRAVAK